MEPGEGRRETKESTEGGKSLHHFLSMFLRDIFRYAMRAHRACTVQVQSNTNPTSGETRWELSWAEDPTLDHGALRPAHIIIVSVIVASRPAKAQAAMFHVQYILHTDEKKSKMTSTRYTVTPLRVRL